MPEPQPQPKRSLIERYVVPPFSMLDARQRYWQDRKRAWMSLGVDDRHSRTGLQTTGSISGSDPRYYQQKAAVERQLGRRITNEEFQAKYYVRAGNLRYTKQGGVVSVFDPVLCEIAYRWFCPRFGRVLDPFAGGAVRGIVAAAVGRRYVGIDLSEAQVRTNQSQWKKLSPQLQRAWSERRPAWHHGDGRDVLAIAGGEFDFVFTCPPYGSLERYSRNPRDLSAMRHPDFLDAYRQIIAASTAKLRPDRFACIVVGDFRDPKGFYRNFVSDTIAAFEGCGLRLYNEAVLATMTGSLPIRVARQFDASRKLGKAHQNVLVFVKGDPKLATAAVGPVELPEDPAVIAVTGEFRKPRVQGRPAPRVMGRRAPVAIGVRAWRAVA